MPSASPCNVLMIYPRFGAGTFWNFAAACELFNAKYPTTPLGLITVAALLPPQWTIRLIDRNTEALADGDLDWADMVMTGGMLPQCSDTNEIIELCRAHGKPVVVGGPGVTSVPERYSKANFQVLGEAEGIIDKFIEAWEAGARDGVFEAEKFTIDVTKTPVPRFDLLKVENYLYVGVQFSRGCPFTCEFCDIIELYGRVPRAKTNAQMLHELEALYRLGYRGHVDFVDDNLIGNKKAVKAYLPELKTWLEQHDYPFQFTTEASLNLADDGELLRLLNAANFVGVFIGIESPDTSTLIAMRKKQNTRRDIVQSVHKIYAAGLYVTAGFIVGFDSERGSVADANIALIEDAAIPVCMVGLLYALPNTQLTRRLASEGRLHAELSLDSVLGTDQCTQGLNFDTLRPRGDILSDYKRVLEVVYEPAAYAKRLQRLSRLLGSSNPNRHMLASDFKSKLGGLEVVHRLLSRLPGAQDIFRRTIVECASTNPQLAQTMVVLAALYLHLGPFSHHVIGQIEQRLDGLEDGAAQNNAANVAAPAKQSGAAITA
jgi:Domain of unknown function (DUF4070)/Radical SAM superfamily